MDFDAVSWLGALVAGIAFFAIGGVWYGPLFGDQWMRATGMTEERARESNLVLIFGGTLVLEIIAAVGLSAILGTDVTPATGAVTGLWVGLVIAVPVLLVQALYERKAMVLWALNGGYNVVGFVLMGLVLGLFQ
jgi:hypothetical protein